MGPYRGPFIYSSGLRVRNNKLERKVLGNESWTCTEKIRMSDPNLVLFIVVTLTNEIGEHNNKYRKKNRLNIFGHSKRNVSTILLDRGSMI